MNKNNKIMFFIKTARLVVVVIAALLISCKTSPQKNSSNAVEVQTYGRAQIFASGEQNAFNSALDEAFRNAVEKVLGNELRSEVKVVDGTMQRDAILSVVSGYVKSYKIVSEKNLVDAATGATVKEVVINAAVLLSKLKKDVLAFALLQERLNLPAVGVRINPSKSGGAELSIEVANALRAEASGFFTSEGYFFVSDAKGGIGEESLQPDLQIIFNVALRENMVSNIGALKNSALQSATLLGEVSLLDVSSGEVIFSSVLSQPGVGLNLPAAGVNASTRIIQILKKMDATLRAYFDNNSNNGRNVLVLLGGFEVGDGVSLNKLISERNIEGVIKTFNKGYVGGRHMYVVRYFGTPQSLGERIIAASGNSLKMTSYLSAAVALQRR